MLVFIVCAGAVVVLLLLERSMLHKQRVLEIAASAAKSRPLPPPIEEGEDEDERLSRQIYDAARKAGLHGDDVTWVVSTKKKDEK